MNFFGRTDVMEKQPLLNTYINNVTMSETVEAIEQMITADKKSYIVAINVDVVMKIEDDIAYLIDEQERRKSTSGGLFFAIATYVIQHDGVVYGAAFDDSMRVTHHRASTKQQVTMLRGSKYVQSDIRLVFQQIIDDLKTKKMVLFSGTPCQVSAVKSFCEKKANCDNLFLLEILCYGVPSPMIFQNHLKQIELNYKDAVCNYLFRDESGGWGQYYIHSADLKMECICTMKLCSKT
jgi:coenzyme F420-reducing hydrogenase beta subunit